MSWRDNDLALTALAMQGYYDEEAGTLLQDTLAAALRDVFLRAPVKASRADILDKKAKLFQSGLTKTDLVDKILPGFREQHQLNDEEQRLLKKSPLEHPELEERNSAV